MCIPCPPTHTKWQAVAGRSIKRWLCAEPGHLTSTPCLPDKASSRHRPFHFVAAGKHFISVERLAQNDTRHQRLYYLKVSKFQSPATEVLASLGVCWLMPCGYPGPGRDPSSQLVMLTIRIRDGTPGFSRQIHLHSHPARQRIRLLQLVLTYRDYCVHLPAIRHDSCRPVGLSLSCFVPF